MELKELIRRGRAELKKATKEREDRIKYDYDVAKKEITDWAKQAIVLRKAGVFTTDVEMYEYVTGRANVGKLLDACIEKLESLSH